MSPETVTMRGGQSKQLTAVVLNAAGAQLTGVPVTFESADQNVATVTAAGLVTGVTTGTAKIIAKTGAVTDTAVAQVTSGTPATAGTP